jgi:hypothetical protein
MVSPTLGTGNDGQAFPVRGSIEADYQVIWTVRHRGRHYKIVGVAHQLTSLPGRRGISAIYRGGLPIGPHLSLLILKLDKDHVVTADIRQGLPKEGQFENLAGFENSLTQTVPQKT